MALIRRLWGRATPAQRAFLLALWMPLVLVTLGLKVWRSLRWSLFDDALAVPALLLSDVAMLLLWGALGLLALSSSSKKLTRIAFVALQLIVVLCICIEATAFNFFHLTGSVLDFDLVRYAFARASETWQLVRDSTPLFVQLGMGLSAALALAAPWVLLRFFSRRASEATPASRRAPLALGGILLGALILALLSPELATQSDVARNAALHLVTSALNPDSGDSGDDQASGFDTREARLERKPQTAQRNVVIILMESTRARAVTPYAPELATTPFLDALAKQSYFVERAHAVMPHTSKALVSTLCGIPPHLTLQITESVALPAKCLAALFNEQGYETAFFQSATETFEGRTALIDNMGYTTFRPLESFETEGFERANYFGVEDMVMLEPSMEWVSNLPKDKPFFLTYLTLTPHHEYLAPRRYGRKKFADAPVLNRYLNAVSYVDHFVENVIEAFKKEGRYEDTLFVVLGDHGEGFGEHKRSQHDNVIYEEGLHIPMIVHDPQHIDQARHITPLVSQLDLLPTLVDLSGHTIAAGTFPGENFLKFTEADEDRVIRSHCWYERRCMAWMKDDQKYIYHFNTQPDQYFDLTHDPLEAENIIAQHEVKALTQDLQQWRANVNAFYTTHHKSYAHRFIRSERPLVVQERQILFGDAIKIIGVDVQPAGPVKPGTRVTVSTTFEVVGTPPADLKLFMHGQVKGRNLANLDHVPVRGLHPVGEWEPGSFIIDSHSFTIPAKVSGESYNVYVGFWNEKLGRLPVQMLPDPPEDNRPLLVKIPLKK